VLPKDGDQEIFFAVEIEVDRSVCDAGGLGDLGDFRVEVTVSREDVDGRAKDALALARSDRKSVV